MDSILSKVTQQAMNYAIRSGITITSGYAIQQCGRLLKNVKKGEGREELAALQLRLESKIKIISPAIDMIELIAARGNTSLESAVTLTKALRLDIESLGIRLASAAGAGELARKTKRRYGAEDELELKRIVAEIKRLLDRIEDAVPLINLAITTSGVNLSTSLPSTVSPSRLLQASTLLTAGDSQYVTTVPRYQQIGPVFTLSMYMLFAGHANRPHDEEGIRDTTWKEVMHKARVKLLRVPLDKVSEFPVPDDAYVQRDENVPAFDNIPSLGKVHEFAYQLLIVEDLDDDRVHDEDESQPEPYEDVAQAGMREIIPIHEVSKIFYADTGKILNIGAEGEANNPILLLKRDINAVPPRRMMTPVSVEPGSPQAEVDDSEDEEQSALNAQFRRESSVNIAEEPDKPNDEGQTYQHVRRLPPNLDLEWIAFEVYTEDTSLEHDSDESEPEMSDETPTKSASDRSSPLETSVTAAMSKLFLKTPSPLSPGTPNPPNTQLILSPRKGVRPQPETTAPSIPPIKTSLSLLEMLIRLTALQQFQQCTHLTIPDEMLTFFLSESATVGSGGDVEKRRRTRLEARQRVGFDPYDESPIKRRGEAYQSQPHAHRGEEQASEWDDDPDLHHEDLNMRGEYSDDLAYYDYESYPTGRTRYSRSRSGTPIQTYSRSSPVASSAPISSADVPLPTREIRPAQTLKSSLSSPSPLLRRVTAQPGYRIQPSRPLTAPNTSSSPIAAAQQVRELSYSQRSIAPETPPPSGRKGA